MKQETKEIIDWIKKQISIARCNIGNLSLEYWDKDKQKGIEFLDSLQEIESHLCVGGYIQDSWGIPCCHGDKVRFQYDEGFYNGTLTFNFTLKCFTIVNENGVFFWINNAIKWFEKVEK